MSLGGLQYTPSVSILAYRIYKILIANLIKYIKKIVVTLRISWLMFCGSSESCENDLLRLDLEIATASCYKFRLVIQDHHLLLYKGLLQQLLQFKHRYC